MPIVNCITDLWWLFYNVHETITVIVSNVHLLYVSFVGLKELVLVLILVLRELILKELVLVLVSRELVLTTRQLRCYSATAFNTCWRFIGAVLSKLCWQLYQVLGDQLYRRLKRFFSFLFCFGVDYTNACVAAGLLLLALVCSDLLSKWLSTAFTGVRFSTPFVCFCTRCLIIRRS